MIDDYLFTHFNTQRNIICTSQFCFKSLVAVTFLSKVLFKADNSVSVEAKSLLESVVCNVYCAAGMSC